MPVETPEDLAIFFDPRDFGVDDGEPGEPKGALYAARTGEPPYRVAGIFDEPSKDFNPNSWPGGHQYQLAEGAHLNGSSPTFSCRSLDLVRGGKARDRLTIGAKNWEVTAVRPDGTGNAILVLTDDA